MTQLKSILLKKNLFDRSRSTYFSFVFVRNNIDKIKLYEFDCIIDKRSIVRCDSKYLV